MLQLDQLTKRYGPVVALDGCSLEVALGEMLGFVGPNGAGKTTAMRTIFGLVVPDAGAARWDGQPVTLEAHRRFGYMPEERGLYPRMPVVEQIVYFGRLHGMTRPAAVAAADRLLAAFGLSDRAGAKLETLSHGNQQRVQMAVALVHGPELLVLDEPFAGLDPVAAETLAEVLAERARQGAAVLFSSHQLDLVEDLCPSVVMIDRGRVVLSGLVQDLRAASPRRYLEVSVEQGPLVWEEEVAGARIVERSERRVRLLVEDGPDLVKLAEMAQRSGPLVEFRLSPPDLSEVFRAAVGA